MRLGTEDRLNEKGDSEEKQTYPYALCSMQWAAQS